MSDFEAYSRELLLSAKLFLQEAKTVSASGQNQQRFLRSAITHAFFFLEAEINYLSSHFKDSRDFDLNERSLLSEKEVSLEKGAFRLTGKDKYFRLDDRIEFLIVKFSGSSTALSDPWYADLRLAIKLRNQLVHPREMHDLKVVDVERCIGSVVLCLSALYRAIFRKDFPLAVLGLHTGPVS